LGGAVTWEENVTPVHLKEKEGVGGSEVDSRQKICINESALEVDCND
jgi:hypothetical protein